MIRTDGVWDADCLRARENDARDFPRDLKSSSVLYSLLFSRQNLRALDRGHAAGIDLGLKPFVEAYPWLSTLTCYDNRVNIPYSISLR